METDSSDSNGESVKSIPRPDFEALSAIDSPQPQLASLLDGNNDMETGDTTTISSSMPSKRQKYVVSAPPGSANGSSNSSSSSPSNANVGSSLTMKLTKVQPHQQQQHQRTSTPNTKSNKVPKEMIALQRSHNESEVLTNFVNEVSKLKRRKSRYVADPLEGVELSRSLHSEAKREKKSHKRANLKRSKSIPAPNWDSEDDWLDDEKSRRARRRSMNCDELHVEDSNSNSNPPPMSSAFARSKTRSRSKTLSLSNEDRLPRRSNLRSENEEFAKKHSAFLDSVINDDDQETELNASASVDVEADWSASDLATHNSTFSENPTDMTENQDEEKEEKDADLRLRFVWQAPPLEGSDPFCWKCRECGQLMPCSKCLRSFHTYCVRPATTKFDSSWKCPECQSVEAAPKRLRRNDVSVELLGQLLFFALERMKHVRGANKLLSPQDVFPLTYKKYFVNPVSFVSLAECIRRGLFQSTEEFLSEVKWIQHNALIMDAGDAKVEQASKAVVKVCRQEVNEIDTCPECYLNANSSDEWFVKVCRHPHLLLWAKLKGFPYWPAKAMGVSNSTLVNVRFFGKHDRAFVPIKDCFLYSAQNPNTQTSRRSARDLAECVREVEIHIENIKEKIGAFCYAEYRTAYDPLEEQQQLEQMMPGVYEAIDRELEPANKTPLQFLIRKTADDKLSMVKKTKTTESGNESDQSGSPVKKPPEATEAVASSEPHPKLNKSSNYEVISRSGESLSDSRCKVLLKRKSMAAKTTSSSVEAPPPPPAPALEAPAPSVPAKRKHSLSDASCTSESSDHKRKAKHAKKQQEQDQSVAAEPREAVKKPCKSPEEPRVEKSSEKQTPKAKEGSPASVVSVVELVRRRQGVTITKIPRDQQQTVTAAPEAPPAVTAPPPPAAAPLLSTPSQEAKPKAPEQRSSAQKQSEVELQQQQLIKKVIPFVEIKTEIMSDPEEEETPQQLPVPEPEQPAQPEPAPVPAAPPPEPIKSPVPENIKIKEELLSEDEMETDQQQQQQQQASVSQRLETFPPMPQPMPPPPPPPLPSRAHVETAREEPITPDAAVRFVGDTTIQKVSQKQGGKSMESTAKRRGPQASSPALSPVPSPVLTAPTTESLSPKSSGTSGVSKPTPAPPPQGQSKVKPSQAQAQAPQQQQQQQQYRQKSERAISNTISSPGAAAATTTTTTSSLLRSNMVVIPVEQATNCNPHSPMTIPVPPLRAVSKSTLQSTASAAVSQPPVAISVPPLAGLSFSSTSAAPQGSGNGSGNGGGETVGGLLASALNGKTSHEPSLVSESIPNDPITPGMATAYSEMLLRSGPPKLVARPSGPLQSDGSHIYPSQAGPVSQKLKENAHKITDYFISVIEDTLSDMATGDQSVSEARIACLSLENERLKQHYDRQLADLQRTSELMLAEMRNTLEQEHRRVISELRQQANIERMRAVDEAKKKQWCANCMREGQLYCCWNTSYCDYPCQQMHWPRHSSSCGQVVNAQLPVSPAASASAASVIENVRSPRSKSTPMATAPVPAPSGNTGPTPSVRTTTAVCPPPAGPVTTGSVGKKWPPMMTPMMNQQQPPPNPETTLLKLPSSTYLRPVVSTMPTTVTATPTVNNSINPMLPSSSGNHMAHLMPGGPIQRQNNTANFNPKPVAQPMPVQRYNIPLPITINPSGAPYGLIAEQHQKQQPAPKAKARRANNTTIRQVNSTNSQPSMRSNQMNQVFQP